MSSPEAEYRRIRYERALAELRETYEYDPYEVFTTPALAEEYRRDFRHFREGLQDLIANVRVLQHLGRFRWEFYDAPREVFGLFARNLWQNSYVIASRLWGPTKGDSKTLNIWKNRLTQSVDPYYHRVLRVRLRRVRNDPAFRDEMERIKKRRNLRYAHLDPASYTEPQLAKELLSLAELVHVAKTLRRIYSLLYLGEPQDFSSSPVLGGREGGQLYYLLDLIRLNSDKVRLFDQDRELWLAEVRPALTQEDVQEINELRLAYRLTPVP